LDSELKKAVLEVYQTAEGLGVKSVLVGALISELSSERGADYPPFRRTNDADFALPVPDWESFRNLRAALIAKDFKQHPTIEHRLLKGGVMVDLIPYGEGIAPSGRLRWPGSGFEMNVIGFKEVCAAADTRVKEGSPAVPLITIPGFVLLKIIAFLDRQERQDFKYPNDAVDIYYWLENYASATEDTRRFDVVDKMGGETVDYAAAGAALLGLGVGQLASKEAGELVGKFLQQSQDLYSPFMDATAGREFAEDTDKKKRQATLELLKAFASGYMHARR
jgi:predicted nucleotidyltransferase